MIALYDLCRDFTQARQSQIEQVSQIGPPTCVPETIANQPVNEWMLKFDEKPRYAVESGPKDLQGVAGVGDSPDEINESWKDE